MVPRQIVLYILLVHALTANRAFVRESGMSVHELTQTGLDTKSFTANFAHRLNLHIVFAMYMSQHFIQNVVKPLVS